MLITTYANMLYNGQVCVYLILNSLQRGGGKGEDTGIVKQILHLFMFFCVCLSVNMYAIYPKGRNS